MAKFGEWWTQRPNWLRWIARVIVWVLAIGVGMLVQDLLEAFNIFHFVGSDPTLHIQVLEDDGTPASPAEIDISESYFFRWEDGPEGLDWQVKNRIPKVPVFIVSGVPPGDYAVEVIKNDGTHGWTPDVRLRRGETSNAVVVIDKLPGDP